MRMRVLMPVMMIVRWVPVHMSRFVHMVDVWFMYVRGDRLFSNHVELRRADAGADYRLRPDRTRRNCQAPERTPDVLERNARVDQGSKHHIAGRAREAVEVQNPHNRSILPFDVAQGEPSAISARQLSRFHERVVPLIGKNQMIEHLNPDHPSCLH